MKESWEELLDEDESEGKLDETLSKEAQEKLAIRKAEIRDNMDSAMELFGEAVPDRSKASTGGDSNSSTGKTIKKLRTKEDVQGLLQNIWDSIHLYHQSPQYGTLLLGLVQKIAGSLQLNDLRKIAGDMQTLCNLKIQQQQEQEKKQQKGRPMLKFGGSLKTSFDLDYTNYDDGEQDEYDEGY
jgi:hypothetical protein